jgi:hypothetical protein
LHAVVPGSGGSSLTLAVYLERDADALELRLYDKAMVCVLASHNPGSWRTGWNRVDISLPQALNPGLYFSVVVASSGGDRAKSDASKFFCLR